MPFIFSFRHMDTSESLENYSEEKLRQTAERYSMSPERMEVTFNAENPQRIVCAISVSNQGDYFHADDAGNYAYDCVDRVIAKIDALMRKAHDKAKPQVEPLRIIPEQIEVAE